VVDRRGEETRTTTEEELRAATVGELKPLAGPIVIDDHDPEWSAWFEREAGRIRSILGSQVMLLEHVGSTSVPDLPAKPVIDMVLAVADSSDESTYAAALEAAGYVLHIREPGWFEHRLFRGPDTSIHLHVFTVGCPEIEQMRLFRDWLRTHPEDRELYETKKRELAKRAWKYGQNYADAKTAVVRQILERARAAPARHPR
jgi:GrpB-like predicted nucleotidyltransferase (UPF0157 family)